MELLRKKDSQFWWYDFTVRGKRYRGSTKETSEVRAKKMASLKLSEAINGADPLDRRAPILSEFSARFLAWVREARLEAETRRYYNNGWRLLQATPLVNMRMDRIDTDTVEALRFPGSPANANNGLRTLRRMFSKAKEWKFLRDVPSFKLFEEEGRSLRLDDEAEEKLLRVAEQPLRDIIVIMRDTGMRNARELYRMRIENINWSARVIFNPNSKTKKGRRFIAMSDRVMNLLLVHCGDRKEGWVFPSRQKGKHITGGLVNKQWVKARTEAGLPGSLVLYCARHDFGTFVYEETGNLKAVMDSMGHSDIKTAMNYQHPELNLVRNAINQRHVLRHIPETVN